MKLWNCVVFSLDKFARDQFYTAKILLIKIHCLLFLKSYKPLKLSRSLIILRKYLKYEKKDIISENILKMEYTLNRPMNYPFRIKF